MQRRFNTTNCVVCGKPQTDLEFVNVSAIASVHGETDTERNLNIGFPLCNEHALADLVPDSYSMVVLVDVT